eukprot:COSAG06_NODE_2531_length_6712_cov_3.173446_7_plen_139_part_00
MEHNAMQRSKIAHGCAFARSWCSVGSISNRKRQPSLHPNSKVVSNAVVVELGKKGPCRSTSRNAIKSSAIISHQQFGAVSCCMFLFCVVELVLAVRERGAHLPRVHWDARLCDELPQPTSSTEQPSTPQIQITSLLDD